LSHHGGSTPGMLGHPIESVLDGPQEFDFQTSPHHAQDTQVLPHASPAVATIEETSLANIQYFVHEICTIVPCRLSATLLLGVVPRCPLRMMASHATALVSRHRVSYSYGSQTLKFRLRMS
jgi:hypothetical protein